MSAKTTKARRPVAADYSSPGPVYMLPTLTGSQHHDPRSEHVCNPSYPFGHRPAALDESCSPGPCYYPDPRYSRTGRVGSPRHAISSRPAPLNSFVTPGPVLGLDGSEGCRGGGGPSAPAYSVGGRNDRKIVHNSPGPNRYMLPSTLGRTVESPYKQAPSHSVKSRCRPLKAQEVPGPDVYEAVSADKYDTRPPHHSIAGKTGDHKIATDKPGPGSYKPEAVYLNKKSAPQFSFGVRHSPYVVSLVVPVK